jgi:vacuolar-type H+-ATPase subunit H
MPISAAVKIDFFAKKSGVDLDIRLEHVALTEEQCVQYRLPRTPIKETETRAASFEARYGTGGTELDALEALHPGVLRQILVQHIERYRDDDLDDRVEDAVEQYRDDLVRATALVRRGHENELAALDRQRDAIQEQFEQVQAVAARARATIAEPAQSAFDVIVQPARATYEAIVAAARRDLDAIVNEAEGRLATLVQQADDAHDEIIEGGRDGIVALEQMLVAEAETLITQINVEFDVVVPDPDQFEWPQPEADEWDNPLYGSTRTYVEQVDVFRRHRDDDDYVGLAADRVISKTCALLGCGKSFNGANPKRIFCSQTCSNKSSRKSVRERRRGGPSLAE